jgi:hypothetical protein
MFVCACIYEDTLNWYGTNLIESSYVTGRQIENNNNLYILYV